MNATTTKARKYRIDANSVEEQVFGRILTIKSSHPSAVARLVKDANSAHALADSVHTLIQAVEQLASGGVVDLVLFQARAALADFDAEVRGGNSQYPN